jgi:hypothetical protein
MHIQKVRIMGKPRTALLLTTLVGVAVFFHDGWKADSELIIVCITVWRTNHPVATQV